MADQTPKYKIGDKIYILVSNLAGHLPEIYIHKVQGIRVITTTMKGRSRKDTMVEYLYGRGIWIPECHAFPSKEEALDHIMSSIHINDRASYRGA